jgi:large subunit ribosomal protein L25
MATHNIPVQLRDDQGKGASRRLRRTGQVPAIVYGGGIEPRAIQIEHRVALASSQHEWFYSSILDLDLDGDVQKVLLRDMQRHPFKQQILHMDFQRVMESEKLRVRLPLHFLHEEKSPAGKTSGVVISHNLTEVEVLCLPKDLPEYIELDLSNLQVGEIIHLSQLPLPAGVEIPELKLGKEHDHTVISAQHVTVREETEEGAENGEGAEDAGEPEKK